MFDDKKKKGEFKANKRKHFDLDKETSEASKKKVECIKPILKPVLMQDSPVSRKLTGLWKV